MTAVYLSALALAWIVGTVVMLVVKVKYIDGVASLADVLAALIAWPWALAFFGLIHLDKVVLFSRKKPLPPDPAPDNQS